ncbi:MAG: S1C family serine protease [Holophagaceae bacterium]|jgi:S1-C subfamily serine protease
MLGPWMKIGCLLFVAPIVWGQDTKAIEDKWINQFRREAKPPTVEVTQSLTVDEIQQIRIFNDIRTSVVYIAPVETSSKDESTSLGPRTSTSATGMVWDHFGHIVTNAHAVLVNQSVRSSEGFIETQGLAEEVEVTLANQKKYKARVIGHSFAYDLAVLQVFAPLNELKPVRLASSSNLKIGQKAMVVGNPYGLDHTLSVGVVSALKREVINVISPQIGGVTIRDAIQVDATINPGNSGGPLLDSQGRVIGMTTEVVTKADGLSNARIAFAISTETMISVIPELIAQGRLRLPQLGFISATDLTQKSLGLQGQGALVESVLDNSPAQLGGLKGTRRDLAGNPSMVGDLIVDFEGRPVLSAGQLLGYLEQNRNRNNYRLIVKRGEEMINLTISIKKSKP